MKKKYLFVFAGLTLALLGYYLFFQKSSEVARKVEYVTEKAKKGTLTSSISGSGNMIVDNLATVDPTISGTVSGLSVKVGDKVEEGQLLFNILNDDLEVSVKKAEVSLEQAKNNVSSKEVQEDQVEADYEAALKKDKKEPTTYTKKQLEVLKDKIDLAEADVEAAKTSLNATLTDYNKQIDDANKRKVLAPITGTVNEVNIKNGDDLSKTPTSSSSKQSPIIIGDLGTLKAQVTINEVDISKVAVGQKATLVLDALDDLEVSGKVEKIDALGTVSQGVVSYNVTIGLDRLDERIKPEMSVSASIITDVKRDVLIVPVSALKNDNNRNYVEILSNDKPKKIDVEIGVSNSVETEIKSGIEDGEEVIIQTINSGSNSNANKNSSGGGFRIPGMGGR